MSELGGRWTFQFQVTGMHCAACASRLEGALMGVAGVDLASVNFAMGSASVRLRPGSVMNRGELEAAICRAGFGVEDLGPGSQEVWELEAERRWKGALIGFVPLAVFSMGSHLGLFGHEHQTGWVWGLEGTVSAAVVFGSGRGILGAAWQALRRGGVEMNTLVGLGAVLSWAASVLEFLAGRVGHGGSYFEAAAGIVTFALLGRWLEARARRAAGDAIEGLAELQPGRVRVEGPQGVEDWPVEKVEPGSVVQVAPGERVPVDGEVISGRSTLDQSWVTGESEPIACGPGDSVLGGTVNGVGALRILVRAAGRHAYLRQVVEIVREAQANKAPIQRMADSMAEGFSMAVLVLAGLTFGLWLALGTGGDVVWRALWRGLTVLVVACPCAVGLATPIAVLVGSGTAARRGILFRSGAALERLSRVQVVVLDKTGTLTSGRMEVVEWWERESFGGQVIRWVASAEQQSAHPVAGAVDRFARKMGGGFPKSGEVSMEAVPGRGIRARVGPLRLSVGNPALMEEEGVVLPELESALEGVGEGAGERNWVAVDGEFAGWFRVADPVRAEAAEVVRRLREAGLRVILLSGDRDEIARRVAREVGIEEVRAGVRPEEKKAEVERLQQSGAKVLMVGDGVNDAPALAQADLGVAMGGGTSVARHTAEITLACGNLKGLWEALEISRRTLRVIRQNLGFAMGYNLLALPLAAGATSGLGWMPGPMLASAAMALSSVSVVLNALRLRRLGAPPER